MDIQKLISIDNNSNVYIGNYWVYIDRDDNIDFLKISKKLNTKETHNKKIANHKLKAKMIDEELEKIDDNFYDEEDINNIQHYLSNPETKYVDHYDIDKDIDDAYYIINGDYNLCDHTYDNSNYEAYFIDHKTNSTIFYSQIVGDNPFYRITFYTDNTVKLNLIGTKIKNFKLDISVSNLDDITDIKCVYIDTEYSINL